LWTFPRAFSLNLERMSFIFFHNSLPSDFLEYIGFLQAFFIKDSFALIIFQAFLQQRMFFESWSLIWGLFIKAFASHDPDPKLILNFERDTYIVSSFDVHRFPRAFPSASMNKLHLFLEILPSYFIGAGSFFLDKSLRAFLKEVWNL